MTVRDLRGPDVSPELFRIHQDWINAEMRGDVEELLKLCTADVQFLAPGAELIVGKHAVRAFLEASNSQLLSVDTADLRFEAGETFAFKTCRFTTRLERPDGSGLETKLSGIHAWLLRRDEGRWLVSYVTWHLRQ